MHESAQNTASVAKINDRSAQSDAMRLAFQRINSKTDGVKGDFPDRTDDRYRHYQCRHDVCVPAYKTMWCRQTAPSSTCTIVRQSAGRGQNWSACRPNWPPAKQPMVSRKSGTKPVNGWPLCWPISPVAETASPSGGPAFVAAAEDAAADAVTFVVRAMSDGSLRIEISRPIYGNFEDADITALCWGAVACD